MKLILFRHGLAIDRDNYLEKNLDDSLRPLVPKGRERTRWAGKSLRKWIQTADLIVSSPLVRAQQTAEVLQPYFLQARLVEATELVPSAPPATFAQWLKVHAKDATNIIAVGHEPQLSIFASWCVFGGAESLIDLKKSGMICLEVESFDELSAKSAILKWVINPKMLNA